MVGHCLLFSCTSADGYLFGPCELILSRFHLHRSHVCYFVVREEGADTEIEIERLHVYSLPRFHGMTIVRPCNDDAYAVNSIRSYVYSGN